MKMNVRKCLLIALIMMIATVSLFSEAVKEQQDQGNVIRKIGEPTELLYWYAYSGVVQETNEYLTKTFNETVGKEKGIHVTAEYQGAYNDLNQKLQAAFIGGESPDIFVMEIGSTGMFAQNGVITELDSQIKRDNFDLSDFQDGLLGNCRYNDIIYGLPYMPSTAILFMNTTILKDAGLDTNGPDTWEELAQYCKTIKEETGLFGLTLVSNLWFYEAFMLEAGTSVLSDDERSTNINSGAALNVIKFWKDLKDAGYVRILSSADGSKMTADIMNQKSAMWFYSTAGITTFMNMAKSSGFSLNTSFMPKLTSYGTSTGGSNLVISNKSSRQEKEAAWEFVKWMTATEQTVYASSKTGYMPSRKSAIDAPQMAQLYAAMPQFKVAIDQMAYAKNRPMNPGYTEAGSIITSALDAVWITGQDMHSVFSEAKQRVDKLLNE
jgi:sn-glycerol 3-phosphate transport system substrate-binding protein